MSDEVTRALEARDAMPGDVGLARRAATLATATGDRALAAGAWQEVLRRVPRDTEAEERLRVLGCELLFRGQVLGVERFESTIDAATLGRAPALGGLFFGVAPVTNQRFERFLGARGTDSLAPSWVARVPSCPHRQDEEGRWLLRGAARPDPVVHATWAGARAYATWAGGRLLTPEEWDHIAAIIETRGPEWVDGTKRGDRPALLHPVRARDASAPRWLAEDAPYEAIAFRYVRESWFAR